MALNVYAGDAAPAVKAQVALSQTDSVLVAAVTGRKIRVLQVSVFGNATAATTVTFNSKPAGSGVAISATFFVGVNGQLVLPPSEYGWFTTVVSEGLTCTTSSGGACGIQLSYTLV